MAKPSAGRCFSVTFSVRKKSILFTLSQEDLEIEMAEVSQLHERSEEILDKQRAAKAFDRLDLQPGAKLV